MIEVKSFKDRKGNKVMTGTLVNYFDHKGNIVRTGIVRRISKAGYFVEFYLHGYNFSMNPMYAEMTVTT